MSDLELLQAKRVCERHGHVVLPEDEHRILVESARLRLLGVMRDLSEDHFYAGWYTELEHYLWDAIEGTADRHPLHQEQCELLLALRAVSGGWWHWNKNAGPSEPCEAFVSREEFKARHAAWVERGRQPA